MLEVMRHTARHSISMSQYGQQITVDVALADSPRELSDNIQARVGVPMEEEPVLYLNGGADNEFMPNDMFEYNEEEKGEEEEEKEEVENHSSLFQDENVNELSNQYTIQPMPEEMVGDLSHLPTEPTQPGARTLLDRLQSSPIGRKIFPKKRTRSARSPAVPTAAAAAAAAAPAGRSSTAAGADIEEVVLNYSETNDMRDNLDTIDVDSDERLLNMDMEMTPEGEEETKNKKKASTKEISVGSTTHFAQGTMRSVYDGLVSEFEQLEEQDDTTMTTREFLIRLGSYVNEKEIDIMNNPNKYSTSDARTALEREFNSKRDELIAVMKRTLANNDDHRLISLGTRFSQLTRIVFLLHYAPVGVRNVEGDEYDKCHPRQCCIATMFRKIANFLANENNGVDMSEYRYGGRDAIDENSSNKMVVSDLIPFLLEKGEDEKDMVEQYESWRRKLNLKSYYEMRYIRPNTSLCM